MTKHTTPETFGALRVSKVSFPLMQEDFTVRSEKIPPYQGICGYLDFLNCIDPESYVTLDPENYSLYTKKLYTSGLSALSKAIFAEDSFVAGLYCFYTPANKVTTSVLGLPGFTFYALDMHSQAYDCEQNLIRRHTEQVTAKCETNPGLRKYLMSEFNPKQIAYAVITSGDLLRSY